MKPVVVTVLSSRITSFGSVGSVLLLFCVAFKPLGRLLVVEPNHSTVAFTVPIGNGLTAITGKFTSFQISLDITEDDLRKSHIAAVIDVSSITTGIPGRDADLLTADFFDTTQFRTITFVSDSITGAEPYYVAHGPFVMHGVAHPISLPFKVTGRDGESTIGFEAHTVIKRSEYGVGTSFKHTEDDGFIGDDIPVDIWFWTKAAVR